MTTTQTSAPAGTHGSLTAGNSCGVSVSATCTGAIERFEVDGRALVQYPGSSMADGVLGLWVRERSPQGVDPISLFGQTSPLRTVSSSSRDGHGLRRTGQVGDLLLGLELALSAESSTWFWHVEVRNTGSAPVELDLLHTHDLALAAPGAVRNNAHYVSQYLDVTPVEIPDHGIALGVRQNMPGPTPWALVGCLTEAVRWATDMVQVAGVGRREGAPWPGLTGELPANRRQGEHTVVALQTAPVVLAPGESHRSGFFGTFLSEHPDATGPADVLHAEAALGDPAAQPSAGAGDQTQQGPGEPDAGVDHRSWLGSAARLSARTASDEELRYWTGAERLLPEYDDDQLLGYFTTAGAHVVTAEKQSRVLRPHGHLLRTGTALVPDPYTVTMTAWMDGSFCSHLTQGHVSLGSVLSVRHSYLGLDPAHGLRLLVRPPGSTQWQLLGTPSAWLVGLDHCRWWYATDDDCLEVRTEVPADGATVTVGLRSTSGRKWEVMAAVNVCWNDPGQPLGRVSASSDHVVVRPADGVSLAAAAGPDPRLVVGWSGARVQVCDDAPLFRDGRSRRRPWLTLATAPTTSWQVTLTPQLFGRDSAPAEPVSPVPAAVVPGAAVTDFWSAVSDAVTVAPPRTAAGDEVTAIAAALPWFAHDALIHYLSPRGLEQYSGGGWGTRDISQGPVGLLLTLGAHRELREVVLLIMRAQHARGDWPQAFQFLDRHRGDGQSDAHGDIVYWPLIVLAQYLAATGDHGVLDEAVPFTADDGATPAAAVRDHLAAAVDHIESSLIAGTGLPAYGHGDWNDSLQPADPALARRMTSTWTAVLQVQALRDLAEELATIPSGSTDASSSQLPQLVARMEDLADRCLTDLRTLLLVDGVLAGYGLFPDTELDAGPGRVADQRPEPLIHPADRRTGLRYSLLPMIHAIAGDLLAPDEAGRHLGVIVDHLLGRDGARLFDRPMPYRGGPMVVFQRAEASTFFGREIGLMYVHAHLRYAEALARVGDGPGLLRALAAAQPIGVTDRITGARPRQSTCYYSSSDATFDDRATADAHYAAVSEDHPDATSGPNSVGFEGGWRVYSSGPGLYLQLFVQRLLGIRVRRGNVEIDPVLDPGLDGLRATVPIAGLLSPDNDSDSDSDSDNDSDRDSDRAVRISFRFATGSVGHGVTAVRLNRVELPSRPLDNPYRPPGMAVSLTDLAAAIAARAEPGDDVIIEVETT